MEFAQMVSPLAEARQLIAGLDREVPLLDGRKRLYVNLDNAATTPPFRDILPMIGRFADWYSSIHRGTGFKSLLSSELYDQCREIVARFVGADPAYHVVIFCANTTDAINKLCRRLHLGPDEVVLTTVMEHHSNLLPWRLSGNVDYVGIKSDNGSLDVEHFEEKMHEHEGRVRVVAVTGASNTTGCMPPIHKIARMAHAHGAYLLVDGAQLVAHRPVSMGPADEPERIDFLAFSAHKMYAPFGTGVLVGPREFFSDGTPSAVGGGTVELVTLNEVEWTTPPEREEAGTPNLMGVLTLAKAIQILESLGMEKIAQHQRELTSYALRRLQQVPGIRIYGETDSSLHCDRVGVIPIVAERFDHALLAAILSYEWGIGVRHGCFCAHTYVGHLFELDNESLDGFMKQVREGDRSNLPGFVRISLGVYNTVEEIEYLAAALETIAAQGPKGRYRFDKRTGEYSPVGFAHDLNAYNPLAASRGSPLDAAPSGV